MFNIFNKKKKTTKDVNVKKDEITNDIFNYHIENDMEVRYPLYVGSKVISVSNSVNSVRSGIIVRFDTITQTKNIVPIVKYDGDDEEYMCLVILIPYTQKMYDKLMDLDKRNDLSAFNFLAPSWCQITDKGEVFKFPEDSIWKEF